MFRPWRGALAGVEAVPVGFPREQLESVEPQLYVTELAERLRSSLEGQLTGAFWFFGHSLGALVAFELTRRLRQAAALQPVALLVSGARAPHKPSRLPPIPEGDAELIRLVQGMNAQAIPPALLAEPSLLALGLPGLRRDLRGFRAYAYVPAEPLSCPIHVFGGQSDPMTTREELESWRDHGSCFSLRILPGDHGFIDSSRQELLEAIGRALA